jgi:hypothetical protein
VHDFIKKGRREPRNHHEYNNGSQSTVILKFSVAANENTRSVGGCVSAVDSKNKVQKKRYGCNQLTKTFSKDVTMKLRENKILFDWIIIFPERRKNTRSDCRTAEK